MTMKTHVIDNASELWKFADILTLLKFVTVAI